MKSATAFHSIGTSTATIDVRLSYKIVELFSEGLYASPNKAIEELVANAFDAGAQRVQVLLSPNLHDQDASIVVIDDGEGMDQDALKQHWLIGISNKRSLGTALPKGRQQIGKFGIGKLATYVLANRLSHVSRRGGKYYATSMDYGAIDKRVESEVEPKTPIKIALRVLTEKEAKLALVAWTETPAFKAMGMPLFGSGAPRSWTVSVMSSLKEKVHELRPGTLEWVLRTALPLRPDFAIWLNEKKLSPSKEGKGLIRRWVLGKDLPIPPATLPRPAPKGITASQDRRVSKDSDHRFGLDVPGLGRISGYAEAYKDLLTGKSDEIGRSYGFFVYVYGRLINVLDGHFQISPNELRHGTFGRFRLVVHMDGLDQVLRSNRESVSEGPLLETAQSVLQAIFNAVRPTLEKHDEDERPGAKLARKLAASPASISRRPILDLARLVAEGKAQSRYLIVPKHKHHADREAFLASLEHRVAQSEQFVTGLTVDYEGNTADGIAQFDTQSGTLRINAWHPFVATFRDEYVSKGAGQPLEILAMAEVLAEAHLYAVGATEQHVEALGGGRDRAGSTSGRSRPEVRTGTPSASLASPSAGSTSARTSRCPRSLSRSSSRRAGHPGTLSGSSVSVSGSTAAVGAPSDDVHGTLGAGSAPLHFDKTSLVCRSLHHAPRLWRVWNILARLKFLSASERLRVQRLPRGPSCGGSPRDLRQRCRSRGSTWHAGAVRARASRAIPFP